MTDQIYIQDYTPKTFIVRGETREYKNSLKSLGGKWNPSLTEKETGEKFGAWLFWFEKRPQVEEWMKTCSPDSNNNQVSPRTQIYKGSTSIEQLDKIYKMLEAICSFHNIKIE